MGLGNGLARLKLLKIRDCNVLFSLTAYLGTVWLLRHDPSQRVQLPSSLRHVHDWPKRNPLPPHLQLQDSLLHRAQHRAALLGPLPQRLRGLHADAALEARHHDQQGAGATMALLEGKERALQGVFVTLGDKRVPLCRIDRKKRELRLLTNNRQYRSWRRRILVHLHEEHDQGHADAHGATARGAGGIGRPLLFDLPRGSLHGVGVVEWQAADEMEGCQCRAAQFVVGRVAKLGHASLLPPFVQRREHGAGCAVVSVHLVAQHAQQLACCARS